jgi:hypothetical protein
MKANPIIHIFTALFLTHCGVEAGNPVDSDPKAGLVQIQFATVDDIFGDSFVLNLADLSISSTNDSGEAEVIESLELTTTEVELFALSDDAGSETDVGTSTVTVGSYNVITIGFDEAKPLSYQATGEDPQIIAFSEDGIGSINLAETIEIAEGETTTIILNFDPRNSLTGDNKADFKFDPMVASHKKGFKSSYEGSTDVANATSVCAYLYSPIHPPKGERGPKPGRASGKRPPPPKGRKGKAGRPPKMFESADDVVKDETKLCENAFQRVRVIDGVYHFRHLVPGTYDFRIFAEDGSYTDEVTGELLEPPATAGN